MFVFFAAMLDSVNCSAQTNQVKEAFKSMIGVDSAVDSKANVKTKDQSDDRDDAPRKGSVYLRSNLLLPVFNWFSYTHVEHGRSSKLGFGYWNFGVDYYHRDKQFVNLTLGEAYDLKLPAFLTYGFGQKDSENIQILYGSLSNNHIIGKLSMGYGLSYGYDRWKSKYWEDDVDHQGSDNYNISYLYSQSLGFVFQAHYSIIGLVYRPMLLQFSENTKLKYQHTLSLELSIPLRIKK